MKKNFVNENKTIIGIVIILVILFVGAGFITKNYQEIPLGDSNRQSSGPSLTSESTRGDQNVIHSGPVHLERVIIGNNITTSTFSLKDATDSASAALVVDKIFMVDSTMSGVWEMGINFIHGIWSVVSSGQQPVFIYTPIE